MRYPDESSELAHLYDPVKAHAYYLRTRKLTGRKKSAGKPNTETGVAGLLGKIGGHSVKTAGVAKQRRKAELKQRISTLKGKLAKLERELKKREANARQTARDAKKPDTAAEKREKARDSKKYRDKHQQELKSKAKSKSGGSSKSSGASKSSTDSIKKTIANVKGKIHDAEQRLNALG
jgi:hypothetical protein